MKNQKKKLKEGEKKRREVAKGEKPWKQGTRQIEEVKRMQRALMDVNWGNRKDTLNCRISSQVPIITVNCLLIKRCCNWTFNLGTSTLLILQLLMCWVLWNVNKNWYRLSLTSIYFNLFSIYKHTSTFMLTHVATNFPGICFGSRHMFY